MKSSILAVFSFIVFSLAACDRPPGIPDSLQDGDIASEILDANYSTLQAKIFTPKCVSCHGGPNPKHGINLTSYANIMNSTVSPKLVVPGNPDASDLYKVVQNGSMPKQSIPLNDQEVQAIGTWIANGAPEADSIAPTTSQSPPNDFEGDLTPNIPKINSSSYSALQANIFTPKCISCHSGTHAPHGVVLTSYDAIINNKTVTPKLVTPGDPNSSELFKMVQSGKMPLDSAPLSAEEIQNISDWITKGALNETTASPP